MLGVALMSIGTCEGTSVGIDAASRDNRKADFPMAAQQ